VPDAGRAYKQSPANLHPIRDLAKMLSTAANTKYNAFRLYPPKDTARNWWHTIFWSFSKMLSHSLLQSEQTVAVVTDGATESRRLPPATAPHNGNPCRMARGV
jgi:hypothetical protein